MKSSPLIILTLSALVALLCDKSDAGILDLPNNNCNFNNLFARYASFFGFLKDPTPFLARLTCNATAQSCNGIANAYQADRGIGCNTQCGGSFSSFAVAGLSGLRLCFRETNPTGIFIKSCYCCFGYVYDNVTNTCIEPKNCNKGFGVY